MKHAAAMKYGGELVAAEDCTYDSFKELVPLCPNCKEPVFLRIGGDRLSVKGNEYKIGPHWCHFKGVSAEQVASCENRVSGYTDKDRQRIATKARGQRLKLLQRWFWNVFREGFTKAFQIPENQMEKSFPVIERELLTGSNGKLLVAYVPCSTEWENKSPFDLITESFSDDWVEEFGELHNDSLLDSYMQIPCSPALIDAIRKFNVETDNWFCLEYSKKYVADAVHIPKGIDVVLHEKMLREISCFLTSNKSRPVLTSTVALLLTMLGCNLHVGGWFTRSMCDGHDPCDVMISALVMAIATIPWAAEFQRLEAESKQNKD
jgi:hypothetical protein